jgi:hypothetical protein
MSILYHSRSPRLLRAYRDALSCLYWRSRLQCGTMTFVKVHGAMRSGTNHLAWMMRYNFRQVQPLSIVLGWKHGPLRRDRAAFDPRSWEDPRVVAAFGRFDADVRRALDGARPLIEAATQAFETETIRYVVACKHPRAWFASVRRQDPGFLGHDVDPVTLAAVWSSSYRGWLSDLPPRGTVVRWEDLSSRPAVELGRIGDALGLERSPLLVQPDHPLHPGEAEEIDLWLNGRWQRLQPPVHEAAARPRASPDEERAALDKFLMRLAPEVVAGLGYDTRS